jgi:four helix bundle protein
MEQGLQSLDIWKKSVDLVEKIYQQVLPALPVEEKYGLNQQIRRAAQSIPANIAEGYGRYYYQEGVRFCYIARGSLEEVRNFILVSQRLNFINDEISRELIIQTNQLSKMINGYIVYLKKSKRGMNEPGSQISENSETYNFQIDGNDYE